MPPHHPMHQISQISHPKNSKYQFDSNAYKGIDSAPAMGQLVRSCCPGYTLYDQKRGTRTKGGLLWSFYCNHYPMVHLKSEKNFEPGKFTKNGAVWENVKGGRGIRKENGNSAFKHMGNSKMKSKQTKQCQRQTADQRGKTTLVSTDIPKKPPTKRTDGVWSKDVDRRCDMHINIFMSEIDGSWYLLSSSKFGHRFHPDEHLDTSLLNKSD